MITAYPLTFGGCLLAAGRLADRVGRRRAFMTGLSLFGLASLACGLASSGAVLLSARALRTRRSGPDRSVGPGLAHDRTAARARPLAGLGWWTAAAAGGGASGWMLGGVLSGLLGWRWVFLVSVPACAAAIFAASSALCEWRDPAPASLDLAGAALVTTGLGALVYAFTSAEATGPTTVQTLASFAAAIVLLAAFARVEARAADPLLGGPLLRRPDVIEPNVVAAVLAATTSPAMFFCILYAQEVRDLKPIEAGLLFPPFNISVIAGSPLGPRVVAALGERGAMTAGLLAVAAGASALLAIAPTAGVLPSLLGGFVLMGSRASALRPSPRPRAAPRR